MKDWELKIKIDQKQSRIDSGTITNNQTLKYAKRDIKRWKEKLKQ